MSYGEHVALRGHADLEQVASAASVDLRPSVDIQFLESLRRGDAAAFERLVNERSGDVYALLYRLTADAEEARDLTQETFLRAFQSISRFRGEANLKTWLYRIAINQARNRCNQTGDTGNTGISFSPVTKWRPRYLAIRRAPRSAGDRCAAKEDHRQTGFGG